MHRLLGKVPFAAVLLAAVLPATPAAAEAPTSGYIVLLAEGVDVSTVAAQHGDAVGHLYRSAVRGYSAHMSAADAGRLARDPRVVLVQPDGVASIAAQTVPTGIDRVDADLSPTAAIDGTDTRVDVDVAVLDTGVDLDHPDLNVYLPGARNCSFGPNANDGHGHGSHVAGTIGALDNGVGVVGVAPGARIWPVKVLNNSGSGSFSDIICGIDYVTARANDIEVANMSLGGRGVESACRTNVDAMHEAICRSVAVGVTYAVAAGNSSADATGHVPANYEEVITVSALSDFNGRPGGGAPGTCIPSYVDDTFARFSNFGADIDLIAPGVCILSTWKNGRYNTISGTSMATPHVAGGAALHKVAHPAATPADVKAALQAAATFDWATTTDPDGVPDRLLNVAGF